MGLDMYLRGEKFYWTDWSNPENNLQEDGFKLVTKELEIGYWRKEPNLHGYIVKKFADGVDECQKIDLGENDILQIIDAIENDKLPHTTGFFFGRSADSNSDDKEEREWAEQFKKESVEIFRKALKWSKIDDKRISRSVYYQASW